MCGIVAYVGDKKAVPILLNGLKQLEYRGYDSAGIAVLEKRGGVKCVRSVGKVKELEPKLSELGESYQGIAHTRWATHGGVTEANAHPHHAGAIWLVHNGIIENYAALREALQKEGAVFTSETDTEVLAHLIQKFYQGNLKEAVLKALFLVEGTYGIAVMHDQEPGVIVVAKNGSPLVIGVGQKENLVASDAAAILLHTDRIVYLEDGEIALITADNFIIEDLKGGRKDREVTRFEGDLNRLSKGEYPHYMLKEIFEQPDVLIDTMRGRYNLEEARVVLGGLEAVRYKLAAMRNVIIVSCGTSYHAGLVAKSWLENFTNLNVVIEVASEFRYKKTNYRPDETFILAISQSGETADTLAAIKEAKRKGFLTLGVVNVVGSSIARETHGGVYTHAGFEIGVASTKAFVTQLLVLALITIYLARDREMDFSQGEQLIKEILLVPEAIRRCLAEQNELIKQLAKKYATYHNFLYLGRKWSYPIALEGALKLKEISYLHSEAYPAGEMKHGPIALIDEQFPSVFVVPKDEVYDKTISNIMEIKARRGPILAIAEEGDKEIAKLVDDVIYVPHLTYFSSLVTVIPLQLFAYYVADVLGCEIDKPKNLAKSVTVE